MVSAAKKASVVAKVATKKTKAKKAKKLVVTHKEPVKCDFNFWGTACSIEEVSFKIASTKDVIELLATTLTSNPESGVAWAAVEMLEAHIQRLETLAVDLMAGHRQYGKSALDRLVADWEFETEWKA